MSSYNRLIEVLKRWPLDKSKGTRDYGLHLRSLAKTVSPGTSIFSGTDIEVEKKFEALLRLADNKYKKMYGSNRSIGASGLTLDQLNQALSEEVVKKYFKT